MKSDHTWIDHFLDNILSRVESLHDGFFFFETAFWDSCFFIVLYLLVLGEFSVQPFIFVRVVRINQVVFIHRSVFMNFLFLFLKLRTKYSFVCNTLLVAVLFRVQVQSRGALHLLTPYKHRWTFLKWRTCVHTNSITV